MDLCGASGEQMVCFVVSCEIELEACGEQMGDLEMKIMREF